MWVLNNVYLYIQFYEHQFHKKKTNLKIYNYTFKTLNLDSEKSPNFQIRNPVLQ